MRKVSQKTPLISVRLTLLETSRLSGWAYSPAIFNAFSVLSYSESGKVSHYIINHRGTYYQIGDQTFQTIPEIIEFYKKYLLDSTTLKEPVSIGRISQ